MNCVQNPSLAWIGQKQLEATYFHFAHPNISMQWSAANEFDMMRGRQHAAPTDAWRYASWMTL